MPYKLLIVSALLVVVCVLVCVPAFAQEEPGQKPTQEPTQANVWSWAYKTEVRANYRWSEEATLGRPFPPGAQLTTVDPGDNVELNVADVQLDLDYGEWFAARALVHGQALHRRNPTSTDKQVDADELWVRFGAKPEFLDRPDSTSFFLQAGKFPKMERQPVRLLESYGLAATSFNRFEDVQLLIGGTVRRNFYWRAQAANGNPFFMRDPNALAGDNGTRRQVREGRAPELGSGFPILYNAETEDLVFDANHVQFGEGLGYRWQRPDETLGFDAIVFHYSRDMADTVELTGTEYGGDLDFLTVRGSEVGSPIDRGLPVSGNKKEELGARVYGEWHAATAIAQYTTQKVAGLERDPAGGPRQQPRQPLRQPPAVPGRQHHLGLAQIRRRRPRRLHARTGRHRRILDAPHDEGGGAAAVPFERGTGHGALADVRPPRVFCRPSPRRRGEGCTAPVRGECAFGADPH
jgi:hypothetical protein